MPVPLLRRAIRRRHSAVDEERGGRVVARHIQRTYGHIQTNYVVSMPKILWLGQVRTDDDAVPMTMTQDGQSMIISGPLVDKPNELKKVRSCLNLCTHKQHR